MVKARKALCPLGLHRWELRFNDSGEAYRECNRCKKYSDVRTIPYAALLG
jgi:hypothetical protein